MPDIMTPATYFDHFAVSVSALSGVLAARGKGLDLFGVLVLALVTALGGGSLRDMLAGDGAAAWLRMPGLFMTVCATAVAAFFVCRWWTPPAKLFQVADALALCSFAVAGTSKGLALGFAPVVSVTLGVMTGVAGGIIRDTLTGSVPLVFRKETHFYATAAMFGGAVYWFLQSRTGTGPATWIAFSSAVLLRLGSIRYQLVLPSFETADNTRSKPNKTNS